MSTLAAAFVVLAQLVAGFLLGVVAILGLGIGDGWELPASALGATLGVWLPGLVGVRVAGVSAPGPERWTLVGAGLGSAAGVAVILLTPAHGFVQIVYPLLGALSGYYVAHWLTRA